MNSSTLKPSTLSEDDIGKKSTWLSNSTYVPVRLIEYASEEPKKEINYNDIIDSDSGDELNRYVHKKRREKKRHFKKIKKRDIIKTYLNKITSIDDDNFKFGKMIFVEELPREERLEASFLDRRGNPYISQYGSICERHVPKYSSKRKGNLSSEVSDRYYMTLKSLSSEKSQLASIVRKECDSHCTCQQFFIPIPYDIVTPVTEPHISNDQVMIDEVSAINESINKDPHDIAAWLRLINVQSKANQMGIPSNLATSIVVERRLMVVERAITKNQSNLQLHLLRMNLGGDLWPSDKLQKEWNQLLFVYNTNIDVWRFYIDQIAKKSLGFSVDKILAIYNKCFSTFFNVMSGRMKTKTIDRETVMSLCDFFADYCDYMTQSGYTERALASWQAVIEYNLFCGPVAPKQSGNLLDDPMLRSLQDYWSECPQHIGQPQSRGWAFTLSNPGPCPMQACLEQIVSERESSLISGDLSQSEMWLELEETRGHCWWLPYCDANEGSHEDPDRQVPFLTVQSSLITVHGPCNLSEDSGPAPLVSRHAKQRLVLLFLDSMDVYDSRVSIKHGLHSVTIRRQQLSMCDAVRSYMTPVTQQRLLLPDFVTKCMDQVRSVLEDGDDRWIDDVSLIQLSSQVRAHLATALNWKEALSQVRLSARTVFATRTQMTAGLWISYGELLLMITEHRLFRDCDRAMKALLCEATKVIQALSEQISSSDLVPIIEQRLSIFALSLDLATRTQNQVLPIIHQATESLAAQYSLNPPQNNLSSLNLFLTEVVAAMMSSQSYNDHWHLTMHFHAVSRLLLVGTEPFMLWMFSECMSTIKDIGSATNWSTTFLYQLSQLLEMISSYFGCYLRCRGLNANAHLRFVLNPFIEMMSEMQLNSKTSITDVVFSPSLIRLCMGEKSSVDCQKLGIRNFVWNIASASETETTTAFNYNCHGSSLLLLDMELRRWSMLKSGGGGGGGDQETEVSLFSGRADRVRSTFNRLLTLRCMHWRYRLALWLAMMQFESDEASAKSVERTTGVFYRAVTEMPAQKCLYTMIVGLVPSMIEEVTTLMKSNALRLCVPLEEIKLLMRIRDATRPTAATDTEPDTL